MKSCIAVMVLLWVASAAGAAQLEDLPLLPDEEMAGGKDWLVHDAPLRAGIYRTTDGRGLVLSNGLIRRAFRLSPNAATVGLDNLVSGESLLRGVKPEAVLVLDGQRVEVGGLKGQPNYAFLLDEWLDALESSPDAMRFTGFEVGAPRERVPWKWVRHLAPDVVWPPAGVSLAMHYVMPDTAAARRPPSNRSTNIARIMSACW